MFPLSGETYCGGHISFSTNISTLIKLFSILEVSDCERRTRVRREAYLSSVMWPDPQSLGRVGLRCFWAVSVSCWSKVTHRSRAGQQLSAMGYHHGDSCSIATRGWRDLWGFAATPLSYQWSPELAHLVKIHFGHNCLEIWNGSQGSSLWTTWSPSSFIATFLTECVTGTVPGSHPNHHHSCPSGQHYAFLLALNCRRCHRVFLITG